MMPRDTRTNRVLNVPNHDQARRRKDGKLGTFLGVFTPTILTILGVIMYLRFGWVTGQMGLAKTIAIVVLANVITLITTLSFSAIATNIRVGVGGAYYIISRSLGLEIGGAIGSAAVPFPGLLGHALLLRSGRVAPHRLAGTCRCRPRRFVIVAGRRVRWPSVARDWR